MGMIRQFFSFLTGGGARQISGAVTDVADSFRPNATRRMELGSDAFTATQAAYAAEFASDRGGLFDALVNGLNRLPRPLLALGTLALFVYAMLDPEGFAVRMAGLATVPDPLWWLLGAVVAFYFGARETYHLREARSRQRPVVAVTPAAPDPVEDLLDDETAPEPDNPALADWRGSLTDLDP